MAPIAVSIDSSYKRKQSDINVKTIVACIGDSITELSGYPECAKQQLGDNYIVGNFGACGTAVSLNSDSPYMKSRAFAAAKEFQPNIAIVMLGTNDASEYFNLSSFVADYLLLLEAIKAFSSGPKVWVVKPPHVYGETWLSGQVMSARVIPAIEEVAYKANLPLIDVYSVTGDPRLFFDGVHPNAEGTKVISEVICQAVSDETG